jgi:hypothetical protein
MTKHACSATCLFVPTPPGKEAEPAAKPAAAAPKEAPASAAAAAAAAASKKKGKGKYEEKGTSDLYDTFRKAPSPPPAAAAGEEAAAAAAEQEEKPAEQQQPEQVRWLAIVGPDVSVVLPRMAAAAIFAPCA